MKKALVTQGGWPGHEPEQCAKIIETVLKDEGFETTLTDTLDCYLDEKLLKSLNLIVPIWTMSQISKEQEEGLLNAVKSGIGIAGWHGGMCDSFRNNTGYQFMTGGQWVAHPGGIIDYEINIIDHEDPVTVGINDFRINSEQYYLHTDPGNKVLATTTFNGEHEDIFWIKDTIMPVIWKRQYGKGSVFYSSLGHTAKDFDIPEVKEIIKRGMLWATQKDN